MFSPWCSMFSISFLRLPLRQYLGQTLCLLAQRLTAGWAYTLGRLVIFQNSVPDHFTQSWGLVGGGDGMENRGTQLQELTNLGQVRALHSSNIALGQSTSSSLPTFWPASVCLLTVMFALLHSLRWARVAGIYQLSGISWIPDTLAPSQSQDVERKEIWLCMCETI